MIHQRAHSKSSSVSPSGLCGEGATNEKAAQAAGVNVANAELRPEKAFVVSARLCFSDYAGIGGLRCVELTSLFLKPAVLKHARDPFVSVRLRAAVHRNAIRASRQRLTWNRHAGGRKELPPLKEIGSAS